MEIGEQEAITSDKASLARVDRNRPRIRRTVGLPRGANETASPEWDHAVNCAEVHLNAGWILPDTKCQSAAAEELAAFFCAYGV
jgi:hypothetical protein